MFYRICNVAPLDNKKINQANILIEKIKRHMTSLSDIFVDPVSLSEPQRDTVLVTDEKGKGASFMSKSTAIECHFHPLTQALMRTDVAELPELGGLSEQINDNISNVDRALDQLQQKLGELAPRKEKERKYEDAKNEYKLLSPRVVKAGSLASSSSSSSSSSFSFGST